jgi:NADPH:quinone reductase-like Zn-dependent oxidoreductase
MEFSGSIVEVSSDVSEWKVDDEVFGLTGGVSDSWLALRETMADSNMYTKIREPMQNI